MNFIKYVNSMFLAPVMLSVLFLCGIFLIFKLRARPIRSPKIMKNALSSESGSSFRSLCVALAGTIGVGNIVGVATAIHAGGAGSVFWMILSAFVAMIIKYAEVTLAMRYRIKERDEYHGGAAYYIRDGIKKPRLAILFSLLCILASLTLGNFVQINACAEAFQVEFGIPRAIIGAAVALIVYFVVSGGFSAISDFTVKMVPLFCILYIIFSGMIIISNYSLIPCVLNNIIRGAFTPNAAFGGILGYILASSIRYGIARGIGSNEAGCGTAPSAHAKANCRIPAKQGVWGIIEVFIDTVLLCTLTAFVILIYPENIVKFDGMTLAIKSYENFFGSLAGYIMAIAIFFFALSTVICWAYYAKESIYFLTKKKKWDKIYTVLYCVLIVPAALCSVEAVWELSDLTVSLMTIINCVCVMILSGEVKKETDALYKDKCIKIKRCAAEAAHAKNK